MEPSEIKALRKELRCTPRELAEALEVDVKTVMAWEADDQFPTKRLIAEMEELRKRGKSAIVRRRRSSRRGGAASSPFEVLRDAELWAVFRKLLAHPTLREQVVKLAASYDEPGT